MNDVKYDFCTYIFYNVDKRLYRYFARYETA